MVDPDQPASWYRLTRRGEQITSRAEFLAFRRERENIVRYRERTDDGGPRANPPVPSAPMENPELPVQSYLVTTPLPLLVPATALISLTLRFPDELHNLLAEQLDRVLSEGLEGWELQSVGSGEALLDRLATLGTDVNQGLRAIITDALDNRAAVLRFSDPTPLRAIDLEKLPSTISAFAKLPRRDFWVGAFRIGACLILITLAAAGTYRFTDVGAQLLLDLGHQAIQSAYHHGAH